MPESRSADRKERVAVWRRLPAVLYQAGRDLSHDNGFDWAAAVAFYALLSTLPLLLTGAYLAALVVDLDFATEQGTRLLAKLVPAGERQVEQLLREALAQRSAIGAASMAVLLWTGTRVFGTLTKALNIAYDVDEVYGFWKRRLTELAMLLSIGVAFLLALLLPWVLRLFSGELAFLKAEGLMSWLVTEAGPPLLLVAAFFGLYRFVPRWKPSWRVALPGAVLSAALFVAAREVFFLYAVRFAEYSATYGSLAITVMLVIWVWVATVLLLYGGEVVSHAHSMLIEGVPADEVEERHRARSAGQRPKRSADHPPGGPSADR